MPDQPMTEAERREQNRAYMERVADEVLEFHDILERRGLPSGACDAAAAEWAHAVLAPRPMDAAAIQAVLLNVLEQDTE